MFTNLCRECAVLWTEPRADFTLTVFLVECDIWIKDDSGVIVKGCKKNTGMDRQCDSLSGLRRWIATWRVCGSACVWESPSPWQASVSPCTGSLRRRPSVLYNAGNKLFSEVLMCSFYSGAIEEICLNQNLSLRLRLLNWLVDLTSCFINILKPCHPQRVAFYSASLNNSLAIK